MKVGVVEKQEEEDILREREGKTGSMPIWVVPAISKIMQLQAFFSETALINNLYSTLYLLLFYPYSRRWRF